MAPIWYAHPDGYLRAAGTGDVGVAWDLAPKLSLAERAQLRADCDTAGQIVYVPDSTSTGLLPGTDPRALAPFGDGTAELAGTWGTTPLEGRIVWGQLHPSTSAPGSEITNSWIAGPRPDIVDANPNGTAYIRDTTSAARVWRASHCIFNAWAWTMPELDPPGGAWDVDEFLFLMKNSIGIRGGRFQLDFCEITGVQDIFNIFATLTDASTDELITNRAHARNCWFHAPLFYRGPLYPSQPEGTHSDMQQWSRPMYLDVEYNLFGGPNGDLSGYALTPSKETSDGGKNTTGQMAQQENPGTSLGMIKSVVTRRNIMWGHGDGVSEGNGFNINHHYNTAYPNEMADCLWEDNLHVQRADGHYVILNKTHYESLHSGHRIITMNGDGTWTDVGPVTLTSGS